jgi:DNA-binding beta-propeller fold protein YncE
MPFSLKRKKKRDSKLEPSDVEEQKPSATDNGQSQVEEVADGKPTSSSEPPSVSSTDQPTKSNGVGNVEPVKLDSPSEGPPVTLSKGEVESKGEETQTEVGQISGSPGAEQPTQETAEGDSNNDSQSKDPPLETPEGSKQPSVAQTPLSSDSFISDTPSPAINHREATPSMQVEDLICVICKSMLTQPKILPCMHSVCRKCERAATTNRSSSVLYEVQANMDEETVHCPKCNEDHVLPAGGFPSNTYLQCKLAKREIHDKLGSSKVFECSACEKKNPSSHYCSDCKDFLCTDCYSFHRSFKATKNHVISNLSEESLEHSIERSAKDSQEKLQCPQHVEPMSMYCEQCEVCLCSTCLTEYHNAHPTAVVDDKLATKQKTELRQMLADTNVEIHNLRPVAQEKDHIAEVIHSELKATQQGITRLIELLQGALAARKDTLNAEAMSIANRKLDPVRRQRETISKIIELYQSVQPVVYAVLGDGTADDIALTKSVFVRRQKKLTSDLEGNLKPMSESTNITLRTSGNIDGVSNALGEIGYVCGGSHPQNSRIHITYKTSPGIALVRGEKLVCEAVMKDSKNQIYPRGGETITANLMHLSTDEKEEYYEGDVADNGDGTYTITFGAFAPGKNFLTVQCFGEDLSNSPMELTLIVKDINMIGSKATVIPCPDREGIYRTVAVGENDTIVVTDNERRRVCVLEEDGSLKKAFGSKGSRDGTFKHKMTGALFDSEGNLYITDDNNGRIQKFRVDDGQVLNVIGEPGSKPGKLDRPRGIAIHHTDKKLYISEFDSHRISVFLPNGQHRHCFGKKGNAFGKLKHPLGVAFGPDGNLYVVDSGNNRIQVFTPEGDPLRSFSNKYASVDLNQPWDIAVTEEGYVLVTERSGNCVSVFHTDGSFILHFGSKGTDEGMFDEPCGIAINGQGQVFVMDSNNKRVQVFTYVHK